MVARLGVAAKLGFVTHPHMLRHACGFQLANQGTDTRTLQAYLGPSQHPAHCALYRTITHAFKNLWRDWTENRSKSRLAFVSLWDLFHPTLINCHSNPGAQSSPVLGQINSKRLTKANPPSCLDQLP